jgi:hypothetical protein
VAERCPRPVEGQSPLVAARGRYAQVGRMVLVESDEDWEHTPEYRGFRPLVGTR